MSLSLLIQSAVDGLLFGGVYAAIGIGLSLAYGVMHVVNWAHGSTMMVAMYIAWYLSRNMGVDPYATVFINVAIMMAFGYFLQHFFFNKMIARGGKSTLNTLLFTTGLGTLLAAVANIIFGAEIRTIVTDYSAMFKVGGIYISQPKLISCVIALAATGALYFMLQKTEMGRAVRAISEDRTTAQLMGINSNVIFCIALAISLGLVGMAGSLMIPFYPVNPYVGSTFQFKSFIIVAIGGRGDIPGAFMGGLMIGLIESIGGLIIGTTNAEILTYVLFIVILLVKPNGLLVRKKG